MITISFGPTRHAGHGLGAPFAPPQAPVMVICFRDHGAEPQRAVLSPYVDSLLVVAADDEEDGPLALTEAQAAHIASFARTANDADAELRICCDGGIGRSAACAAALLWASENPEHADDAVFSRGDVAPNRHVFDLVREALLGPADEDEAATVEEMFERQRQLFDEFHATD